jgi:hypothetical protein
LAKLRLVLELSGGDGSSPVYDTNRTIKLQFSLLRFHGIPVEMVLSDAVSFVKPREVVNSYFTPTCFSGGD